MLLQYRCQQELPVAEAFLTTQASNARLAVSIVGQYVSKNVPLLSMDNMKLKQSQCRM